MRRVIPACIAMLAAMSIATAAHAADVAQRSAIPTKAPGYVVPFSWDGLYGGINGGWAWGRSDWDVLGLGSTDFNVDGGIIGGSLGYNWQLGATVLGLEGDLDWSNVKGSSANAVCIGAVCEMRNNWLGTTRGRIGYAFGRMMPYFTGGAAFGDVKMSSALGSETETRVGWTLGGGVEAAIVGPWSARLEYLYTDLGKANCGATACGASTDVGFHNNLVRGGINYHF